jgi:chromosome segregation ATPase
VDKEGLKLKAAIEQTRAAEAALADADKELKDMRAKVSATKKEAATLEDELRTRLDRVQNLKADEERLTKIVDNQKLDLQGADSMLKELQSKIDSHQTRLSDFIHVGGKMLGLGEAIANLESRQSEITKAIRKASEEDLAIQVKLNAAQEALNRELTRAEQARKDREAAEAEFKKFSTDIQKQAATLQNYELEQKKRIAELEKRINDHAAAEARIVTQIEQTKAELTRLDEQRSEMARAEAQLKHWQEIEKRLRGQLGELEEKHEILRRGLGAEESTVIMFANDLIKRIDLIDALKERYAGVNGGVDIVAQLVTLRQSFEDILLQHGVSEFEVASGTEVDVELRKRIAVVDSTPGKNKPRVVESCRTGFVYSRSEGHEVILRKVEVRTSSQ